MDRIKKVQFSNCVMGDKKLYGFLDAGGYPFEIDLETREIKLIDVESMPENPISIDLLLYDDQIIYILELNGERLIQYDTNKQQFRCVYINYEVDAWGNFLLMTKKGNYIYIFPKKENCLIKIDIKREVVLKEKLDISAKESQQFTCAFRKGDMVWIFSRDKEEVWMYDLQNEIIQNYKLNHKIDNPISVSVDDKNAYLLGEMGNVYTFSLEDYSVTEIRRNVIKIPYLWGNIVKTKKNVWLLPSLGEDIYIINLADMKEKCLIKYPNDFSYADVKGWSKYYGYSEDEQSYYFAMRLANYMLKIDKNSGVGEWIKLISPFIENMYNIAFRDNTEVREDIYGIFNLQDFFKFICNERLEIHKTEYRNIGKNIYKVTKENN